MSTWGRLTLLSAVPALVAGCNSTFVDLTPDGWDAEHDGDGFEPDADVLAEDGSGTVFLPPPPCGNGVVDPGEECDDGNRMNGDECSWDCLTGTGDPPGPADPAARPYVVEGTPLLLQVVDDPPDESSSQVPLALASSDAVRATTWFRNLPGAPSSPSISTRFLEDDGSPARPDVVLSLASGWTTVGVASAATESEVLLVFRTGPDGLLRARLSADTGLVDPPSLLVASGQAWYPALAAAPGGYLLSWYDGSDTRVCEHNGAGPSRVFLRRLAADGSADPLAPPAVLEDPAGAWTPPDLAAGDDATVGLLWWRASTEVGGGCTLRVGVADSDMATIADGGAIAEGLSGRIADSMGAFRVVWLAGSATDGPQVALATIGRNAVLLDAPVVNDLPLDYFLGQAELAVGDSGLVVVIPGSDDVSGQQLLFLRTDLFGRAVAPPALVDPTCTGSLDCSPGPFGIVWTGDAFLVIYFATLDADGPSPTTEMRMVRLVPAS